MAFPSKWIVLDGSLPRPGIRRSQLRADAAASCFATVIAVIAFGQPT
jgi:hypothetical protein